MAAGEARLVMHREPLLPAAAVIGLILAAHLSLAPGIADADSFYHLGHAAQYADQGLFDTSFPWATQSVIADLGADLWWGFHVSLVPFATGDVASGIRVAAFLFTVILAGAVWWLLRRHRLPGPGWWTLLFLAAVPNVLYRYLMVRPHVLSLAGAFAILSLLVRGRWWQVMVVAALIAWLHLSLFWMAPALVVAYAVVRTVQGRPVDPGTTGAGVSARAAIGAVVAGTLLGWLLRPHPLASAQLAYVQIVRLFAEKGAGQPLLFATELSPLPVEELLRSSWLFVVAWVGAVLTAVIRGARAHGPDGNQLEGPERTLLFTTVLVSATFLALSLVSARRAVVEFVAIGFLAIPIAWRSYAPVARRRVTIAFALLLVAHVPWAARRHLLNVSLVAFPPNLMVDASDWLEANSAPGDIVFHAHWDNFGPLFAANRRNHYLGGMDPIFQFAHDPALYWEYFYLSGDLVTEYTCDAFPCHEGTATETHAAIRDHFGARWVLVEPRRNPELAAALIGHPGFELAYETPREAIFRVLTVADPSPASVR
jgi:hypothetical protein